jgi:hypothetical protein
MTCTEKTHYRVGWEIPPNTARRYEYFTTAEQAFQYRDGLDGKHEYILVSHSNQPMSELAIWQPVKRDSQSKL